MHLYIHISVYIWIYIHICIYLCVYIRISIQIYLYLYVYLHAHVCIYLSLYMVCIYLVTNDILHTGKQHFEWPRSSHKKYGGHIQWNNLHLLKERTCYPKILYSTKYPWEDSKIKEFSADGRLEELGTRRSIPEEMLKAVLKDEEKWYQRETWNPEIREEKQKW